jgi:hypothetical protein
MALFKFKESLNNEKYFLNKEIYSKMKNSTEASEINKPYKFVDKPTYNDIEIEKIFFMNVNFTKSTEFECEFIIIKP